MPEKPTLVQCDFDGTITVGDVSFQILDEFTGTGWRNLFSDYMQGKISVNAFNSTAFSQVKATRETLDAFVKSNVVMRKGLGNLISTCSSKDWRFYIVSNGMRFYIDSVLKQQGIEGIPFAAADAIIKPDGIESWYTGPDGTRLERGFKEAYTRWFLEQGYRVIYIGNGISDLPPARLCHHIFAIENLLEECRRQGVPHTPFGNLDNIAAALNELD